MHFLRQLDFDSETGMSARTTETKDDQWSLLSASVCPRGHQVAKVSTVSNLNISNSSKFFFFFFLRVKGISGKVFYVFFSRGGKAGWRRQQAARANFLFDFFFY